VSSDLHAVFAPDIVEAIEQLIEEKVRAAVAAIIDGTDSPWLILSEAANYMRVSERQVQRLVRRGCIRPSDATGRRVFHRGDLDAFMRATTGEDVAPTTPPRRRGRSLERVSPGA
jgi:excisionase family DNA binding protein